MVAFAQSFIWAMGTYATPSALGPDTLVDHGLSHSGTDAGQVQLAAGVGLLDDPGGGGRGRDDVHAQPQRQADVVPCLARQRWRQSAGASTVEPLIVKAVGYAFTVFVVGYILIPIVVTLIMSFNDAEHDPVSDRHVVAALVPGLLRQPAIPGRTPQQPDRRDRHHHHRHHIGRFSPPGRSSAIRFRSRASSTSLIMLPLFMPGVVLGLGVAIAFGGIKIFGFQLYGSRLLVMIAHSLWAMPLVFMLMEATFRTIDHRIVEASYDLGGRPIRTFLEIVVPAVSTGIISSALFAFVISLNEFVMALFLTDRDTQTLPVLMWLSLRSAGTPRLAVAAVVLASAVFLCLTVIMLWYVRQLRKRRDRNCIGAPRSTHSDTSRHREPDDSGRCNRQAQTPGLSLGDLEKLPLIALSSANPRCWRSPLW